MNFFEILTLKQLGRHNKQFYYNIDGFFDELDAMMDKSIEKNLLLMIVKNYIPFLITKKKC